MRLLSNILIKGYTSLYVYIQYPASYPLILCYLSIWLSCLLFMYCFNEVKGCDAMKRKDTLKVDDVKETSEIVHAALKQLNSLPDNISKGAVTGKEVENYKKQANRLKVLCEAGNIGKSKLVPQFTEISIALQVCVDKLNMVKEYQVKLVVVKDYCKLISKGMYYNLF